MLRDIILMVVGAILGAFLGILAWRYFQRPMEETSEARKAEDKLLKDADASRRLMRERDMFAAVEKFETLTKQAERLSSESYWGLAKTYADWATERNWRGLVSTPYPDKAKEFALKLLNVPGSDVRADVALAYAYESNEANQEVRSATRNKIIELLEKQKNNQEIKKNSDIQYLAWLSEAAEDSRSYPDRLRPEEVSDLRILLDVAMDYARSAGSQSTEKERKAALERAQQFLSRAELVSADNAVVYFLRGYVAAAQDDTGAAREYYERALTLEGEFPRARNNLGFVYAAAGDYEKAREQFRAATLSMGAVPRGQRLWLHNLGSASFEVGKQKQACDAWTAASRIPGASEEYSTYLGLALCDHAEGRTTEAVENFRRAIVLGQIRGEDLTKASTFQSWKAGPKELQAETALLRSVRSQ